MSILDVADTALRTFTPGDVFGVLKNVTLVVLIPLLFVIIAAVIIANLLAYFAADSDNFDPFYQRRVAVAAANAWQNRDQYGYPATGRTFDTLGPLEVVLDALANSIKKWEVKKTPPIKFAAKHTR